MSRIQMLLLSSCMALSACGGGLDVPTAEAPSTIASSQDPIWAQTPGAHQTTKELTWDGVVGPISSGYTLTSWASAGTFGPAVQLNALYRDGNGCLRRVTTTEMDGVWHYDPVLINCNADLASDPAAVSWGPNRIDVFWFVYALFGGPAELRHAFWDGSTWRNEVLHDTVAQPASAPVVASWGVGHLDVMYRDNTGMLWRREFDRAKKNATGFDANGWQLSDSSVASVSGDVALAEPTTNELHVFYRSGSGTLMHRSSTNDGASWGLENTLITIDGVPSATTWGPGRLDVAVSRTISGVVQLKHIWRIGSADWSEAHYTSHQAFGQPRLAAALGRPNRFDVVGTPDGTNIYHSLYQESLPGFAELNNPQPDYWCFANSSGMVVNYLNQPAAPLPTCVFASSDLGANCCAATVPDACLSGGSTSNVLSNFGVTWSDERILTADELRFELLVAHRPVIAHEDHNNDSGSHVVVIRDIYKVAGVDYVALVDPANRGLTWVWPYTTLINYNGNWHIDYMYQGLRLQ